MTGYFMTQMSCNVFVHDRKKRPCIHKRKGETEMRSVKTGRQCITFMWDATLQRIHKGLGESALRSHEAGTSFSRLSRCKLRRINAVQKNWRIFERARQELHCNQNELEQSITTFRNTRTSCTVFTRDGHCFHNFGQEEAHKEQWNSALYPWKCYKLFTKSHHRHTLLSLSAAHRPSGGARNSFPLLHTHSW